MGRRQAARQAMPLTQMEAEAAALRRAAEARLIRIAGQVGFFEAVVTNAELVRALSAAMVRQPRDLSLPPRVTLNKLGKINDRILMAKARQSKEERARDARRKILLGSFLISEFQHDPDLLERMRGKLSDYLNLHKDAHVRAANRALLEDVLEGQVGDV